MRSPVAIAALSCATISATAFATDTTTSLVERETQELVINTCHDVDPNDVYFCPLSRYCDWNNHTVKTRVFLKVRVGYDRRDWNYDVVRDDFVVERTNFADLNETVRSAMGVFGFDEDRHDCCLGHYENYAWEDFTVAGFERTLRALGVLGYNGLSWNAGWNTPYENFKWDDMPSDIRTAAEELCYNKELWDGESLPWPTDDASRLPGQIPASMLNTSSPTTSTHTSAPTNAPTAPSVCPFLQRADQWCPAIRYCGWDHFDDDFRRYLRRDAGYSRREWNFLRRNPFESVRLRDLNATARNVYESLGYDEQKHDCCNAHFESLSWSELQGEEDIVEGSDVTQSYEEVRNALAILGHTEESWTNRTGTVYDDIEWDLLPYDVRFAAANRLCYNRELWNGRFLPWPADVDLPNAGGGVEEESSPSPSSVALTRKPTARPSPDPTPAPTSSPTTASPLSSSVAAPKPGCRPVDPRARYWCPVERYCEWDSFPTTRRATMRSEIGYSRTDWNYMVVNPVEKTRFEELGRDVREGLADLLGFDEDRHDCCQNHYEDYDWTELDVSQREALSVLGHDEETWRDDEDEDDRRPTSSSRVWDDLSEEERNAARELCWTKETWDEVELTNWPDDAEIPGSTSARDVHGRPNSADEIGQSSLYDEEEEDDEFRKIVIDRASSNEPKSASFTRTPVSAVVVAAVLLLPLLSNNLF